AHYVDDALVLVAQRVDAHAELLGVAAQRLDLGARGDVGDRILDVDRGGVVVLGRDRLIDAAGGTPLLTQPVECLWAGDLVQELEVDVQQVRFSTFSEPDHVIRPDLLREGPCHVDPSPRPGAGACRCPPVRADCMLERSGCERSTILMTFAGSAHLRLTKEDGSIGAWTKPRRRRRAAASVCWTRPPSFSVLSKPAPRPWPSSCSPPGWRDPLLTAWRWPWSTTTWSRGYAGTLHPGPAAGGTGRCGRGGSPVGHGRPGPGSPAGPHRRVCPAVPPSGRSPDLRGRGGAAHRPAGLRAAGLDPDHEGRFGRADPAGLGGAGPSASRTARGAFHRHSALGRTSARLGAVHRRARAGRGLGLGAGARAQ